MSDLSAAPGFRIVVVEDEPFVRELAVCELEDCGFKVDGFGTADEAMRHLLCYAAETAVVFTDVQMPGRLDGLALTALVARSWPSIRVLVTSGGSSVDTALLPSCARFIPKPWRATDIVLQVTELMATDNAMATDNTNKSSRFDRATA